MLIWKAHEKKLRSLAFSPDGTRIATTTEKSDAIWFWEATTGKPAGKLVAPFHHVCEVAFFPDGRHVAGHLKYSGLRIWNTKTQQVIAALTYPTNIPQTPAVSLDGSRLLVAVTGGIAEWATPTQPSVRESRFPDQTIPWDHHNTTTVGFSRTGAYFCIAGWYFHLLNARTMKETRQFRDPTPKSAEGASVSAFAFSADDSRLVLGLGHRAVVWSPADVEANPVHIAGHGKTVKAVGFLPDGNVLTAGFDGTARVWDSNTGAELRSFDWGIGKVRVAAVSPDGTVCAAGSDDGHIVVWDVDF